MSLRGAIKRRSNLAYMALNQRLLRRLDYKSSRNDKKFIFCSLYKSLSPESNATYWREAPKVLS